MKTLHNGKQVETTIKTDERIFKITTYDDEIFLCNLSTAYEIIKEGYCKNSLHLWDFQFKPISKKLILDMFDKI